jgi:MarR family transcriptional regulator, transcriptional regulator for hemolysin
MQSGVFEPGDPLGRQLALTGKVVSATIQERLAAVGGSLAAWVVLRSVDGGLSQRELAARIHVEAPTLVRHLDRLESEGLVVRRRDDADRRIVRVTITADGRRLRSRLQRAAERFNAELCSLLDDDEQRVLVRALTKVRDRYGGALNGLLPLPLPTPEEAADAAHV